jgi:hypothetical protein
MLPTPKDPKEFEMTDFEYQSLTALVVAYGAVAVIEYVQDIVRTLEENKAD